MRFTRDKGHEVGIHCYDHIRWQDGLATMSCDEVSEEFGKALQEFWRIFKEPAKTAGSAGWQANAFSLAAYDHAGLVYASDVRGSHPFFPRVDNITYKTLQIPTTLPTLDELLGRPEYPEERISDYYLSMLRSDKPNILTIHAEIEGMKKIALFRTMLERIIKYSVRIIKLNELARDVLRHSSSIPTCNLVQGTIDGRSGTLAVQQCARVSTV
jgi:peptidoglycan/xylan/chitin deacetylase (PgdA/CDA1 family)